MLAPIQSGTSQDASPAALKQHLGAIAVMLDYMNPVLALWRRIDRGSELGLNETKGYAGHANESSVALGNCESELRKEAYDD